MALARQTVAVDPLFGRRLSELRQERGYSLRVLGKRLSYSHTYLWEIETGRKLPSLRIAEVLDVALDGRGELTGMVAEDPTPIDTDEQDRVLSVASSPHRLDTATVDALTAMLAYQRRLEDTAGSAQLVAPVVGQLGVIETLLADAPDRLRPAMTSLAAQWAQFAGWLCAATNEPDQGRAWYLQAMEWAGEAGDADMVATALSMRGHLAWTRHQYGPMLRLSQAAQAVQCGFAVQAIATQQQARAHAVIGDASACDAKLDEAEELAYVAAERPDELPPWMYFYKPDFFILQRGLAQRLLGRHQRAVELLTAALDELPAELRHSDWIGWYVCQLAASLHDAGDIASAADSLHEARTIGEATASVRLRGEVERVALQLRL